MNTTPAPTAANLRAWRTAAAERLDQHENGIRPMEPRRVAEHRACLAELDEWIAEIEGTNR